MLLMKWFVVLFVLMGMYAYMLMFSMNTVLGQTKQMQEQYQTIAEQADQIASGASLNSH